MELTKYTKTELITELEKLQIENKQLKDRLLLSEDKIWNNIKILITKISHEMKTPLNSIIGFSELFKFKTEDVKLKQYLTNILTSADYLLSLVQNLIDITKAQYKPLELSYSIFNTKDTIDEVLRSFPKESIVSTTVDITICADYTRFKQLIYNLISNAIKYSIKNIPVKIISYVENTQFCCEVTDYGEGIDKKDFVKIFEFFTQVSDDINKRQIGSGIGLALCKAITQAHKGNIEVSSILGQGSTFTFKIPVSGLSEHTV